MSAVPKAVFLSYASQDAEVAKKICETLRAAGVEVWFDQSELVGGDAWDAKIRKQIADCALFVPVISAATQARTEGYFRLEWKLAAQRTHMIADDAAFVLPIVIDDTRDADARVPAEFKAVQWTRLPGGEPAEKFCTRVQALLGGEGRDASPRRPSSDTSASPGRLGETSLPAKPSRRVRAMAWIAAAAVIGLGVLYFALRPERNAGAGTRPSAAPLSEARKLVAQARQLFEEGDDANRQNFFTAEELLKRALALDPTDGEVWAAQAQLSGVFELFSYDRTPARREARQMQAERALKLAPNSFEAELAYVGHLRQVRTPAAIAEAIARGQALIAQRPADSRVRRALGLILSNTAEHFEAALTEFDRAHAQPGGDPVALTTKAAVLFTAGRCAEAEQTVATAFAARPLGRLLVQDALLKLCWRGDLDGAAAALDRWPAWLFLEDRGAFAAGSVWLWRGEFDRALAVFRAAPRDYFQDHIFTGPRSALVAIALELAGRPDAAREEWVKALHVAEAARANDDYRLSAATWRAVALSRTGDATAATAAFRSLEQNGNGSLGRPGAFWWPLTVFEDGYAVLGRAEEALPAFQRFAVTSSGQYPRAALQLNPAFAGFRKDPRFAALLTGATAPAGPKSADDRVVATAAPADKSVAVLAFANLSDDKANEYFSDGISEELLNVLAKVPGLAVRGRSSGFYFKGKQVKSAEIGQQINVAYLVQGSVRRAGDRVRISAQLIRSATDEVVWSSGSLDRDVKDIFAVQDEIAAKIAAALTDKLGMTLPVSAKTMPEAYTLYLQARATLAKRGVSNLREAVRMFEKVTTMDPDYLPARSGMAITLALLPAWSRSLSLGEGLDLINRARREARLVIDRQPGNAEAWSALGLIYSSYDWRWQEAGEAVVRSLALAPNDAEIVNFAGDYYRLVLADPQAVATEKRAVELNPLQVVNHNDLAVCHLAFRQYELVIEPGRRAISIAPEQVENYDTLFRAFGFLRRFDEMREVMAAARRNTPAGSAILANMEILAAIFEGRAAEALRLLGEFRPHVEQGGYSPAEYGYNYLWLGHPDKALPWLTLGVKGHDLSLVDRFTVDLELVAAHPVTRVVLEEPGLKELMEIRARHARAAKAQK